MDTQPIYLSDNYRSSFLIRVKKVNGKTNSVWFEVGAHNDKLVTTVKELQELIANLGLEQDIPMKTAPITKPKIENWRYVCRNCNEDIPAFADHPETQQLFCAKCKKWKIFDKKVLK